VIFLLTAAIFHRNELTLAVSIDARSKNATTSDIPDNFLNNRSKDINDTLYNLCTSWC